MIFKKIFRVLEDIKYSQLLNAGRLYALMPALFDEIILNEGQYLPTSFSKIIRCERSF